MRVLILDDFFFLLNVICPLARQVDTENISVCSSKLGANTRANSPLLQK